MSKRPGPFSLIAPNSPDGVNIGYARVSTEEQKLDLQVDALKAVNCHMIYVEKRSATSKKRPELDRLLRDLRPGDTLCVWRLDRFARSMRDLLARLALVEHANAKFRSLTEGFDTTTANGRLILYLLGALAEFESQLTVERTQAGIAAARERGVKFGAVEKLTAEKRAKVVAMWNERNKKGNYKWSTRDIAEALNISVSTINNRMPGGRIAHMNGKTVEEPSTMTAEEISELKDRLDHRLNDYICGMKERYDDSICGFNAAWDIMREFFTEIIEVKSVRKYADMAELEAILNSEDDRPITIHPNGSITPA